MKNKIKNGISLVILAITIVVMIILAGSAVTITTNIILNSQKATFSEDLIQIEDAVETYYIDNNSLPIKEGGEEYSLGEIQELSDLDSAKQLALNSEIVSNFDDKEGNIFYQIDLTQIAVTSTTRGNETSGDADIYVVSKATRTVYYIKGEKIGSDIYFSTVKLIDSDKIEENQVEDNSSTSITAMTNIKVKKSTSLYTNNLILNIEAILAEGETLRYKFDDTGTGRNRSS